MNDLRKLHSTASPAPWYTVEQPWRHADTPTYAVSGNPDPHCGNPVLDSVMDEDKEDCASLADLNLELAVAARNALPLFLDLYDAAMTLLRSAYAPQTGLPAELGHLNRAAAEIADFIGQRELPLYKES